MQAVAYFETGSYGFYRLEEEGQVLVFKDGSTLLYTAHLQEFLTDLALRNLPHLDVLLLLLAATRLDQRALQYMVQIPVEQSISIWTTVSASSEIEVDVKGSFSFLLRVAQLPEQYHQGEGRIHLMQLLLTDLPRSLSQTATLALSQDLAAVGESLPQQLQQALGSSKGINQLKGGLLYQAMLSVQTLHQRYPTTEALQQAIEDYAAIALDLRPDPADLLETEQPAESDTDWRQALLDHKEAFPIVALAPRLQAGLRLPKRLDSVQQRAAGGLTDLSNQGQLDQLLLSEHAYDSLFFLSRLVNREALYQRREGSSTPPERQRIWLLDVSLHNWGTPKLLNYAIAWAQQNLEQSIPNQAIYAVGKTVQPLDWSSQDGFLESLSHVAPCLDACEGLATFLKEHRPSVGVELIWVSARKAQTAAVQQCWATAPQALHYGIYTQAEGGIQVVQYQPHYQVLQQLQLPLEQLWHRPKALTSDALPEAHQDAQLPILPPMRRKFRDVQYSSGLIFLLTTRHELLCYAGTADDMHYTKKGWKLLLKQVPDGLLWQVGRMSTGDFFLLVVQTSSYQLVLLNIRTGEQQILLRYDLRRLKLEDLIFHDDAFYALGTRRSCFKISLQPELTMTETPEELPTVEKLAKEADLFWEERQPKGVPKIPHDVLQRIHTVRIHRSPKLALVINDRHELRIDATKARWVSAGSRGLSGSELAARVDYARHRFMSGHMLEIDQLGFLILKAPQNRLPPLYIPLTLNRDLGLATMHHFSGDPYFCPQQANTLPLLDFQEQYLLPWLEQVLDYQP